MRWLVEFSRFKILPGAFTLLGLAPQDSASYLFVVHLDEGMAHGLALPVEQYMNPNNRLL